MSSEPSQASTPKCWVELVDPYPPIEVDLVGCPGKATLSPLKDDFRRELVKTIWPSIEKALNDSDLGVASKSMLKLSGYRVRYQIPPPEGEDKPKDVDVDGIVLQCDDLDLAKEAKMVIDRSGCMINTWWSSFDFKLFVQVVNKPPISAWGQFLGRG